MKKQIRIVRYRKWVKEFSKTGREKDAKTKREYPDSHDDGDPSTMHNYEKDMTV